MGVRFWTWDPTPRAASRPRHSPSADGAPRRALLLQGHLTAWRRAQVSTESDPLAGRLRSSHVGEEPCSLLRQSIRRKTAQGALLPRPLWTHGAVDSLWFGFKAVISDFGA